MCAHLCLNHGMSTWQTNPLPHFSLHACAYACVGACLTYPWIEQTLVYIQVMQLTCTGVNACVCIFTLWTKNHVCTCAYCLHRQTHFITVSHSPPKTAVTSVRFSRIWARMKYQLKKNQLDGLLCSNKDCHTFLTAVFLAPPFPPTCSHPSSSSSFPPVSSAAS